MGKKEYKFLELFKKILKRLRHDLGPVVYELFVYSFILMAVWLTNYLTGLVVPEDQLKEYAIYKSIFIKSTMVLSGCAALLTIFVRVLKRIRREIDDEDGDDNKRDDDPDDKNDGEKLNELPSKSPAFDETEEIKAHKKPTKVVKPDK